MSYMLTDWPNAQLNVYPTGGGLVVQEGRAVNGTERRPQSRSGEPWRMVVILVSQLMERENVSEVQLSRYIHQFNKATIVREDGRGRRVKSTCSGVLQG